MKSRHDSATRFVIAIVTVGLLAFLVVVVSGVAVIRQLAETQAIEQAKALTRFDARLVERRITDRMVDSFDSFAKAGLARIVGDAVGSDSAVKRVKIWKVDGDIGEVVYYSDFVKQIGDRQPLGEDELDVLENGGVVAEVSDLEGAENRLEQGLTGPITEVYTRIETPSQRPLLFETYQSSEAIASSGREIAATFTPVLILTLGTAAVVEVALAVALIRRFRRGQHEREALMEAAMEASFRERRRIAGDLHDGPVQEMAGLSLGLAAQAAAAPDERTRETLNQAVGVVRSSVRTLRSAIVGVYPPNLEQMGLEAALSDLLARLPTHQVSGHLSYDLDRDLEH
ncbi:MAG TPA: histidine kinase, partial [Nocardioidaceae bacterium]|nr:histidine kinase [Nocardioidaceae bacterium]